MEVTHLFSHEIYPKELSTPEHSSIVENKFTDISVIDCDFTDEVTDVSTEKSNTNTTDPVVRRYPQKTCRSPYILTDLSRLCLTEGFVTCSDTLKFTFISKGGCRVFVIASSPK